MKIEVELILINGNTNFIIEYLQILHPRMKLVELIFSNLSVISFWRCCNIRGDDDACNSFKKSKIMQFDIHRFFSDSKLSHLCV